MIINADETALAILRDELKKRDQGEHMAKVIVVENCYECPYYSRVNMYADCLLSKDKRFDDNAPSVPEWCKLDDHEDIDWTREGI